jgi:hypothetical protein
MGLDMYAYKTKAKPEKEVDFGTTNFNAHEIHYWRKHPNLHGWMEQLYYNKGGQADSFNCVNVELTQNDLLDLRNDISDGLLPRTVGFCYGQSDGSEIEDDLQFVDDALKAIEEGDTVYYSSWW